MKCPLLRMTRFRRRSCLIIVFVLILAFINLLLCTWKWQDNEFKSNTLELTFLRKKIILNHKPFTKAAWHSKANPEVLDHSKSGQIWTKGKQPKPTRKSQVYQTMLRKEDLGPVTNENKQFITRTGRLPVRNGIISKVRKISNGKRG